MSNPLQAVVSESPVDAVVAGSTPAVAGPSATVGHAHDHGHDHGHAHHESGSPGLSDAAVEAELVLADAFCQRRGERLTPIRRKVLGLLLASGRATKAYTLLDEMRKVHSGSAPPTVYRALDFLLSVGLVHRVESINAFAACHDLTHCHHGMLLVCQQCGAVREMHEPEIERVLLDKIKRSGYRLASDAAELKGICPDCQTAEALAAGDAAQGHAPERAGSTDDGHGHRHNRMVG